VQGARCQVQGPGARARCARCQVPGARCQVCKVPGARCTGCARNTRMHSHAYTHALTLTQTHAYTCTFMRTNAQAQARKHKRMHMPPHACMQIRTKHATHIHTPYHRHTHTHATTQSRTCMHICIHTHANTEIHFPCPARLPAGDILDVCSGFMEKAAAGAGVPLIRPLWGVSGPDLLQVRAGLLATCSEPPQKSLCNAAASAAAGATATCGAAQALAPCSSKLRRLGAGTKVYIYEQIIPLSPISAQNTGYAS